MNTLIARQAAKKREENIRARKRIRSHDFHREECPSLDGNFRNRTNASAQETNGIAQETKMKALIRDY